MALLISPTNIIFGVYEPKRIVAPSGQWRLRMRNDDWVRLFVRPPEGGIRHFILTDEGDYWYAHPDYEQGSNTVFREGIAQRNRERLRARSET